MDSLYELIESLGLENAVQYVIDNNKSDDLPYHDNFHSKRVLCYAITGANYYGLSIKDKKILGMASLFHDFNHTGSGKDDSINIEIAKEAFLNYCRINKIRDLEFKCKVISCINATRFPYTEVPENLLCKIIRDADVLQGIFCPSYIENIVLLLFKEMGYNINDKDQLIEIFDKQEKFMVNCTFLTDWANDEYKVQMPITLAQMNFNKNKYYLNK